MPNYNYEKIKNFDVVLDGDGNIVGLRTDGREKFFLSEGVDASGSNIPEWQPATAYGAGEEFTFRTTSSEAVDIDGTAIPANKTMIGAYRVAKTSTATLTNAEMALIELRGAGRDTQVNIVAGSRVITPSSDVLDVAALPSLASAIVNQRYRLVTSDYRNGTVFVFTGEGFINLYSDGPYVGLMPAESRMVCEGDSITYFEQVPAQNWQYSFIINTDGKFYYPINGNLAVIGSTATSAYNGGNQDREIFKAERVQAVRDLEPHVLTVMIFTNDLGGGLDSLAKAEAEMEGFRQNLHSYLEDNRGGDGKSGAHVVLVASGIAQNKHTRPTLWDENNDLVVQQLNKLVKRVCDTDSRLVFVDVATSDDNYTIDTSTNSTSLMLDGIHPRWPYMYAIGERFARAANAVSEPIKGNNDLNTNLLTNPTLSGTGGTLTAGSLVPIPTGVLPDNITLYHDIRGVTIDCSTFTEGGIDAPVNGFELNIDGVVNRDNRLIELKFGTTGVNALVGEAYEMLYDIEVTGARGIKTITHRTNSGVTPSSLFAGGDDFLSDMNDGSWKGTYRARPATLVTADTTTGLCELIFTGRLIGDVMKAKIRIKNVVYRRVENQTIL